MKRTLIQSGAPWEARVGYSRAVRVGDQVWVSGTAPVGENGETVAIGDAYAQTVRCIEILRIALLEAGAELADVVRTRLYVTDISQWEAVGKAHAEAFGDVRPATAMLEVSGLIAADMLVEIEATAVVGSGAA